VSREVDTVAEAEADVAGGTETPEDPGAGAHDMVVPTAAPVPAALLHAAAPAGMSYLPGSAGAQAHDHL